MSGLPVIRALSATVSVATAFLLVGGATDAQSFGERG